MTTTALAMMLLTMLVVTAITCIFFYKVLTAPPKPVELPHDSLMDLSK